MLNRKNDRLQRWSMLDDQEVRPQRPVLLGSQPRPNPPHRRDVEAPSGSRRRDDDDLVRGTERPLGGRHRAGAVARERERRPQRDPRQRVSHGAADDAAAPTATGRPRRGRIRVPLTIAIYVALAVSLMAVVTASLMYRGQWHTAGTRTSPLEPGIAGANQTSDAPQPAPKNSPAASRRTPVRPPIPAKSGRPAPRAKVLFWKPGVRYTRGALVIYNGLKFRCLGSHVAQMGLEPAGALHLWDFISAA